MVEAEFKVDRGSGNLLVVCFLVTPVVAELLRSRDEQISLCRDQHD